MKYLYIFIAKNSKYFIFLCPKQFDMFHNKKLTIFGHEIYCRDNYRFMKLPPKQVVINNIKINLPNPEINVGKYYYLKQLSDFSNDSSNVDKFLKILNWIYKHAQRHYDKEIVDTLVKYCPTVDTTPTAPFFTIIYLAMLDLEIGSPYPIGSGKSMVYKSCKAVLLHKCDYRTAANMFSKKVTSEDNNTGDFFYQNYEEHYERTDSSPENDVMDALENGNGEYFGY